MRETYSKFYCIIFEAMSKSGSNNFSTGSLKAFFGFTGG